MVVCRSSTLGGGLDVFSEKLDSLLIFASKHLCLAPFDQDVQRPVKQLGVHAMEI